MSKVIEVIKKWCGVLYPPKSPEEFLRLEYRPSISAFAVWGKR